MGGCTLEAVEAICAFLDLSTDAVWVLERVASLSDKSFLQQTEQEDSEPRFVMLETIRESGLEALAAHRVMEFHPREISPCTLAALETSQSKREKRPSGVPPYKPEDHGRKLFRQTPPRKNVIY